MSQESQAQSLWDRVSPGNAPDPLLPRLQSLLEDAMTRQTEYRRLNIPYDGVELPALRGLILFYGGTLSRNAPPPLHRETYRSGVRRLSVLELQARGRYLALGEGLQEPERSLILSLGDAAEERWKKLLKIAGKTT